MSGNISTVKEIIDSMFMSENAAGDAGECPGEPQYCEHGAYLAQVRGPGEESPLVDTSFSAEFQTSSALVSSEGPVPTNGGNGGSGYRQLGAQLARTLRNAWNGLTPKILAAYQAERPTEWAAYQAKGFVPFVGFSVDPETSEAKVMVIWKKPPTPHPYDEPVEPIPSH